MSLSCYCHLTPTGTRCLNCYLNWKAAGGVARPDYRVPPDKYCACGVIIRDASFDQCAVHRPRPSRQLPCSFAGCGRRVVSRSLCYLHLKTMQARERLRASGSLR